MIVSLIHPTRHESYRFDGPKSTTYVRVVEGRVLVRSGRLMQSWQDSPVGLREQVTVALSTYYRRFDAPAVTSF